MKDLDKIKEAQAREGRRAESIARGEAQLLIGRGPADRALLLTAVPDMIREIDERGAEIVKARNERDAALAEIERLKKYEAIANPCGDPCEKCGGCVACNCCICDKVPS